MTKDILTQDYLKSILHYNPDTGIFTWAKIRKGNNRRKIGEVAGWLKHDGYWYLYIDGKMYYAHRMAWFYVYGELPALIDHIDGNKLNNAIVNLRPLSKSKNCLNVKNPRKNNTTGFLGVRKQNNSYIATIKHQYLGSFKTPEEAHEAYLKAKHSLL